MEEIKRVISRMTLEEKASLCSGLNFWYLKGIERLDIPSLMLTDGPHGLRKQEGKGDYVGLLESVPATCFPTASALAATWNRELIYQVGEALGDECRAENVAVILGPGANIKRSPLCGRNFEYFSEDPYLSGEMAKSHINGVQSKGIGTSLKHFAVNNQEYRRMTIDAVVDERAMREIYLAGYEIAVKEAQPWTVMCAYNQVNGTYCAEHRHLMTDILKEEWGHEGLVVTDWGAMNDRVEALKAGVELEMPGSSNGNDALIVAAVQEGQLDEVVLDNAVERLLQLVFKAQATLNQDYTYDRDAHHALARRAAGEGAVLLKNEAHLLPLAENCKVALIGRFAREPRYQGAGSSLMKPTRLDTLYDEMVQLVGAEQISYAPGYTRAGDAIDQALINEAVDLAQTADVVVLCAGLTDMYEIEGLDRDHMRLPPEHDALIAAVAEVHDQVVVVLSNGAPVEMPWAAKVSAILEGYLGGQAGAGAQADILYGRVNPSGKLAETFPLKLEDNPSYHYFPGGPSTVEYRESIYVGYRYYDTVQQDVLFPFGHGLSYTSFAYRDLQLDREILDENETLRLTFKVKNTGNIAGKETAQVYIRDVESAAFRPDKELKGFEKVALNPGEEREIAVQLGRRAFAYFNTEIGDWTVEPGTFELLVGASAQDIRLRAKVEVESTQAVYSLDGREQSIYHQFPKGQAVSQEAFERLLGRKCPPNEGTVKGSCTINTPIGDMSDSFVGRQLIRLSRTQMEKMIAGQEDTPTGQIIQVMAREAPLRAMLMMANGRLSRAKLDALVELVNGNYFAGSSKLIRTLRK